MVSHKVAAVETCTKHEREQGHFGVHETLQMSALQMWTSGIPSMEILMSDLYVNMQFTEPRHLSGFFQLSFPYNYLLQGRGDFSGGQNLRQQQLKPRRAAGEFVSSCG